jgi:hypothetical protein
MALDAEKPPAPSVNLPGPRMSRVAWIALTAVYVLWGSTYLGIHYTIESIAPLCAFCSPA